MLRSNPTTTRRGSTRYCQVSTSERARCSLLSLSLQIHSQRMSSVESSTPNPQPTHKQPAAKRRFCANSKSLQGLTAHAGIWCLTCHCVRVRRLADGCEWGAGAGEATAKGPSQRMAGGWPISARSQSFYRFCCAGRCLAVRHPARRSKGFGSHVHMAVTFALHVASPHLVCARESHSPEGLRRLAWRPRCRSRVNYCRDSTVRAF